ncbi:hypothetical protein [Actinomadura sp.]|uniref:hypothetical protein n=1 Tax=Actinomadura sp. TaxID=1989 RepID=UPI0037CCBC2C
MSTRFLALFTTTAAVSVTLTAGIAAATASLAAPPPSPAADAPAAAPPSPSASPSPSSSPSSSTSAAPSAEDDGAKECADADCEIKIHDGQTITLDKKYGVAPIHIGIEGSRVTFTIRGSGSSMKSTVDAGWRGDTSATYNGITLRPRQNRDGTMTLKISHN